MRIQHFFSNKPPDSPWIWHSLHKCGIFMIHVSNILDGVCSRPLIHAASWAEDTLNETDESLRKMWVAQQHPAFSWTQGQYPSINSRGLCSHFFSACWAAMSFEGLYSFNRSVLLNKMRFLMSLRIGLYIGISATQTYRWGSTLYLTCPNH